MLDQFHQERAERYQTRYEECMDVPPFYDIARWGDAEDELETLLRLLHMGKTDEALDMKDRLIRQYADYEASLARDDVR